LGHLRGASAPGPNARIDGVVFGQQGWLASLPIKAQALSIDRFFTRAVREEQMAIEKSSGQTSTEQDLSQLCQRTSLNIWAYPNPYKADGKELCDLLVVFENMPQRDVTKRIREARQYLWKNGDRKKKAG
jgi:hypothetical protein